MMRIYLFITHSAQRLRKPFIASTLIVAQLFYVFGGLDVFFALSTPFAPKSVDAAYGGKHLRTVEYVLGAGAGTNAGQTGTDMVTTPNRASDANLYAGTAWSTSKATAGAKSVVLSGSGIKVVSAYLDVTAGLITAVDVSDLELSLDVNPSQGAGWDTPVSAMTRNGVAYSVTDNSGLSSPILAAKADVTSLFQIQSDTQWNSGVSVTGMMSVVGPTWVNATMKLIITYEENYSLTPHTETKTVRFPLRSTVATDNGTRAANCAAGTTCSFRYSVGLPDLANTADIKDVWFELSYVEDGVATATVSINGGAAGVAHSFMESLTDGMERFLIYRPAVGGANFGTTTQQLDIAVTGTAIGALGGEVVVTYNYNTGATTQVETVQYFMGQQKTLPTTSTTTFTQYPTISNASPSIRNIWFKVHDPVTNTPALRIGGKIGSSGTTTVLYAPTLASPRGGSLHIVHDVGAATTSWTGATTPISVEAQHAANTYDAPPAAEAFITFYWSGASGGTVTKSAKFFAGQSGASMALAQATSTFPFTVVLPETVTKTYRSSYLSFSVLHTDATSIIAGTMRFGLNGSTTYNVAEGTEDTESYRGTFLAPATTTGFLPNQTIPWNTFLFRSSMAGNQLEEYSVSVEMVVTYDADFAMNDIVLPQKHLRTVEYVLGAGAGTNVGQTGTDMVTTPNRASDANMYAGTSWNATKATAGTKNIVLSGSGIQVVSAYLDVTAGLITAIDVSDLELALDVRPSQGTGWDTPVSPMRRNGVAYTVTDNSGVSSPILAAKADVTSLLQIQSDSDWNSGVAMVGMMSVVGPTWVNATMKLIITYEENYSLTPHTETKTVRFPLRSTVATDNGTRAANCAAGTTCSFRYSVELPDLANTADIKDVWFELSYVEDGVATATVSINGGAAGVAHSFMESLADGMERFLIYRPAVGGTNFGTSTQQLDIAVTGTAIGALGGEVVVTYNYNTGATTQVETVQYFMGQQKTLPGTATTTFTQYPTISNASPSIRNIWFKVHDPVTNTPALRIGGKIGASATTTALYAPTLANTRGGTLHIIHDVGAATTSWSGSSATISVEAQHAANTYDAPPAAEAFITFYWSGASGGTVTKSAKFFAGQSGAPQALAQSTSTFPFTVVLPETVTKTYRSSYLSFSVLHTDATSIIAGTMRFGLNGSTTYNVAEATEDTENYRGTFLAPATTTDFLLNQVIPWNTRMFTSVMSGNQTEEYSVSTEMVVTYDADLELLVPHFEQNFFRVYVDNDSLVPTPAWPGGNGLPVGENGDVTLNDFPPMNGENVRLRMSVIVATTSMAATTTQFKLQYGQRGLLTACSAIGTWTDLGNPASGSLWRGVAGTPIDNQELSNNPSTDGGLLLSLTDRAGSYEEQNDTRINPFNVAVGEELEFDWNIESNGVATDTPYCFRMTQSNGTVFDAYHFYPTLWTAGYTPETRNWQWFDDETNADPSVALAGENVAPSDVVNANTIKLRITVDEVNGSNGVNQRFKVQYSQYSDFSQGIYDVLGTSTCATNSLWCYGDGIDADGGGIVTRRLSDSTGNGTHNESSTTPSNPLGGTATEYEFTLKHAGARANATYFFRLFDVTHGNPVLHALTKSYPSLATQGATVSSSVGLLATSTVTEGVTTDIATTPTEVPYGRLPMGTTVTAAQRFSVSSNSTNGYQLFLGRRQPMLNEHGTEIAGHAGTNTTPISWVGGCASWLSSCFGYHAGDDSLSESSTRFVVNDTYAHLESSAREVAYNSGPVVNEETDVIFKIEARPNQEPGNYTSQLYYVVVPIF